MARNGDIEKADRLSRRRARMLPALAVIFIAQQASYISARIEDAPRAVDHVKVGAWLILSIVLLLALMTGGFWFHPKPVRSLLDDEVTRAHRVEALRVGFVATMACALALYALALFQPVGGTDAIHLLVTVGIGAALLRFAQLERRAHRDG